MEFAAQLLALNCFAASAGIVFGAGMAEVASRSFLVGGALIGVGVVWIIQTGMAKIQG